MAMLATEARAVNTMVGRLRTVACALLLGLATAVSPVVTYAQHHGGGGAHFSGGAHFGGAHFGGVHYGGAHYAGGRAVYSHGFVARGAVGFRGGYYGHAYWGGGYWHGVWWPRAYYFGYFPWFLAALPVGCAVYWWGGIPYYYYDDVYYTYSPADQGYVVTDPPPAGGDDYQGTTAPPPAGAPAGPAGGDASLYIYPRHGQTDQQTATDRYECHKWAVSQTGFDPTTPGSRGSPADYRRAMIACLDARGYSAN